MERKIWTIFLAWGAACQGTDRGRYVWGTSRDRQSGKRWGQRVSKGLKSNRAESLNCILFVGSPLQVVQKSNTEGSL